ncbi:MAG: amphi-Trp domain-containing protein [Magnetococcales bacterium]|nr:amphi-Trp domain-containing protein [Magnetococcales bacterium]
MDEMGNKVRDRPFHERQEGLSDFTTTVNREGTMLKLISTILTRLGIAPVTDKHGLPEISGTHFRHDGPKTPEQTAAFLRALAESIEGKIRSDSMMGLEIPKHLNCTIQAHETHKKAKVHYDFKIHVDWSVHHVDDLLNMSMGHVIHL